MRAKIALGLALMLTANPVGAASLKDMGANGLDSRIDGKGTISKGAIDAQRSGEYGTLQRETIPGGAIQGAWDKAPPEAGVYNGRWTPGTVLRMRLREGMISIIALPAWDTVSTFSLADQTNFSAQKVQDHAGYLEIWTNFPGFDTNLTIVGKSGNIYAFYVRGETWNSKNVPDVVTYVRATQGAQLDDKIVTKGKGGEKEGREKATAASVEALGNAPAEWLRRINFNPYEIRLDREMSGDSAIAPELIFRDTRFTYLDYVEKPSDWPAPFEVKDGVDVPVRTRKSPDGRFMVIESIGPLTLRLGEKTVCIRPVS